MKTYRLRPEGFEDHKRKLRRRMITYGSAFFLAASGAFYIMDPAKYDPINSVFVALIFITVFIFSLRSAYKTHREYWDSFEILFDESAIERRAVRLPNLRIERGEITKIVEVRGNGLTVKSSGFQKQVVIPSALEGYDELRARLETWKEIKQSTPARVALVNAVVLGGALALIFSMYAFEDPRIIVPCGIATTLLMVFCLVINLSNPHLDTKLKWSMVFLLGPLLFVVFKMMFALGWIQ